MPATEVLKPSVNREFADLVVAILNGQAWSQEFRAERSWLPTYDLEDVLDRLTVFVVPTSIALVRGDRNAVVHSPICEVGFMLKPDLTKLETSGQAARDAALDAAADARCGLVEEICDYFSRSPGREVKQVGDRGLKFNIMLPEVPTLVLREHLEELGQVTSVIRLTGSVRR